jgi:hypothetical protein
VTTISRPHSSTGTRQRWALVLMGAWLAGTVCTSVVATENFYTIDRLLAASPNTAFAGAVQRLGQPQARDLLRYLSSELNRLYFQMWNVAQLGLGLIVLWLVAGERTADPFGPGDVAAENRAGPSGPAERGAASERRVFSSAAWGVVAMLAIVVLMLVWLTPAIVSLGRALDFVPRDPPPSGMQRFWMLHAAYTSLEMIKLAAGVLVAYRLASAH